MLTAFIGCHALAWSWLKSTMASLVARHVFACDRPRRQQTSLRGLPASLPPDLVPQPQGRPSRARRSRHERASVERVSPYVWAVTLSRCRGMSQAHTSWLGQSPSPRAGRSCLPELAVVLASRVRLACWHCMPARGDNGSTARSVAISTQLTHHAARGECPGHRAGYCASRLYPVQRPRSTAKLSTRIGAGILMLSSMSGAWLSGLTPCLASPRFEGEEPEALPCSLRSQGRARHTKDGPGSSGETHFHFP